MLRELHAAFGERGLVILAFPTRDFLKQEFKEPAKVKAFGEKNGPPGMVMLMTKMLKTRPGWWLASEPSWNFKGQWVVLPNGERQLVDGDPFATIATALEALPADGEAVQAVRRLSAEGYNEPYPECSAKCEVGKALVIATLQAVMRSPLLALLQWRKNMEADEEAK